MLKFISETALAEPLVGFLQAEGWTVYQEVLCRGSVIDIVARRGVLLWIIECKLAFNLSVLEQAYRWRRLNVAHLVSVAVERPRRRGKEEFRKFMLEQAGIGYVEVQGSGVYEMKPRPHLFRRISSGLELRDEQLSGPKAGSYGGGHWTPFRGTVDRLIAHVRKYPGCSVKDAVASIEHHYSNPASAKQTLVKRIEDGIIKGVKLKREGRNLFLHPE